MANLFLSKSVQPFNDTMFMLVGMAPWTGERWALFYSLFMYCFIYYFLEFGSNCSTNQIATLVDWKRIFSCRDYIFLPELFTMKRSHVAQNVLCACVVVKKTILIPLELLISWRITPIDCNQYVAYVFVLKSFFFLFLLKKIFLSLIITQESGTLT